MISRCETSLILVLSHGFSNKLFFQHLILFIMSISILHFWATSSFQVRTEPGSLWSPSLLLGGLGSKLMDECPSWPATCAVSTALPAENERSRMFSVPLQSTAALPSAVISQVAFVLNTHCVVSLPLFTCMSTEWLLCIFQCSNPSCYWSSPSQCKVELQCVLLLTMFNRYVN